MQATAAGRASAVLGLLLVLALSACRQNSPPSPVADAQPPRLHAGWAAGVNRMPPGPPSLHVSGTLHMPHPGFEATLMPKRSSLASPLKMASATLFMFAPPK